MLTVKRTRNNLSLQPPHPRVSGVAPDRQQARFYGLQHNEPGSKANVKLPRIGAQMRSKLVYSAGLKIENRFLLSATAMRAVRKLHVSSCRTEDTLNRVFTDVAEGRYIDVKMPEITPPPAIDALVVVAPLL